MRSENLNRSNGFSLRFESPDTVFVVVSGDVDTAPVAEFLEQLVQWATGKPYVVLILDVTRLRSYSAGARKILASNGHRLPPRVFAHFGGSYSAQVMVELVARGSSALGSKNRWVTHWPNEASARSWMEGMRPILAQQAKELSDQK